MAIVCLCICLYCIVIDQVCVFHSLFLPTPPPRGAWVFRWQVSPPPPLPPFPPFPPLPHLQICQRPLTKTWFQRPLTIETENAVRGGGRGSFAVMRSCFFTHTPCGSVGQQMEFFFSSFSFFRCDAVLFLLLVSSRNPKVCLSIIVVICLPL